MHLGLKSWHSTFVAPVKKNAYRKHPSLEFQREIFEMAFSEEGWTALPLLVMLSYS